MNVADQAWSAMAQVATVGADVARSHPVHLSA